MTEEETKAVDFEYVKMNCPIVHGILTAGGSAEKCIVHLFCYQQQLLKRIQQLETIVPRKIKQLDGSFLIWHCPDSLIP